MEQFKITESGEIEETKVNDVNSKGISMYRVRKARRSLYFRSLSAVERLVPDIGLTARTIYNYFSRGQKEVSTQTGYVITREVLRSYPVLKLKEKEKEND